MQHPTTEPQPDDSGDPATVTEPSIRHPAWCYLPACAYEHGGPHLSEPVRGLGIGGFVQLRQYPGGRPPVIAIITRREMSLEAAAGINAALTSLLIRAHQ